MESAKIRLPMNQNQCTVCKMLPAPHIFKIMEAGKEKVQYLCSEHFLEIDDPKRFFSILEDINLAQEETFTLSSEIFSD